MEHLEDYYYIYDINVLAKILVEWLMVGKDPCIVSDGGDGFSNV